MPQIPASVGKSLFISTLPEIHAMKEFNFNKT
jgi:hypothetical protein